MTTEDKILNSARKNFLIYGYYGTTIEKIAREAGVSKAIVHYYFRTKDKLYQKIVEMVVHSISHYKDNEYPDTHHTWFLISELRNNRTMFLEIISNKMGTDWIKNIQGLIKHALQVHATTDFVGDMNPSIIN